MTLGFTDFRYKTIWKECICYVAILLYSTILILLDIEGDPMYFLKGNEMPFHRNDFKPINGNIKLPEKFEEMKAQFPIVDDCKCNLEMKQKGSFYTLY